MINGQNPKVGDFIWIDSAPLVASPQATGKLTEVEVGEVQPDNKWLYVRPVNPHGTPLWIEPKWVREGDTPGSISKKLGPIPNLAAAFNKVFNQK